MATDSSIIVAVASPPGPGRRGLVRLSGPGLHRWLDRHLSLSPLPGDERWPSRGDHEHPSSPAIGPGRAPRGLARGRLRGLPGVPDGLPCLALIMHGPASYTGEDSAELLLPGGSAILDAVVEGLLRAGRAAGVDAGPAGPGAFTARAWQAGRLGLAEAEAVAATIAAEDDASLAAARELAGGAFRRRVASVADEVATTLARLEAGIDFIDEEDVVVLSAAELAGRIGRHREAVADLMEGRGRREQADAEARVILTGRPNAGKSTLFNALVGRGAAIASPVAGTTRDVLEAELEIPGSGPDAPPRRVRLLDAAGLDPDDPPRGGLAAAMHARAAEAAAGADLRLWCVPVDAPVEPAGFVDASPAAVRMGAAPDDGAGEGAGRRPRLVVRTMLDRLGTAGDRRRAIDHAAGDVWVSARTGAGLSELRTAIGSALEGAGPAGGSARPALLARHREALDRAASLLAEAAGLVAPDARVDPAGAAMAPELVASVLRASLDELGSIDGDRTPDDVLGLVFSQFCIGK